MWHDRGVEVADGFLLAFERPSIWTLLALFEIFVSVKLMFRKLMKSVRRGKEGEFIEIATFLNFKEIQNFLKVISSLIKDNFCS